MEVDSDQVVVFAGSSHPKLGALIASNLGLELGKRKIELFPDGEISVQILESVRGKDVFIVQSIAARPNFYFMELLLMMDALKRASCQSISVILPYYGYCRQDRKDRPRVPIAAKLIADLLEKAGANRVLSMDLHADQVQGFFNVPFDHICARKKLAKTIEDLNLRDLLIVSPDSGSTKRARNFANQLGVDFAIVEKRRVTAEDVEVTSIIGDVKDKNIVLVDDMCSTAGTLTKAAFACRENGAKRIFVAVTHALMVGKAIERIESSPIEKVFVSNTIPDETWGHCSKIVQVSVAEVFANAIKCVVMKKSINSIFEDK